MNRAFSLIEMLIAISLMAMVSTFVVISTNYSNRVQAVAGTTLQIKQALELAKANAVNGKKDCTACGAATVCGSGDTALTGWRMYISGTRYYTEGRCSLDTMSFWTGTATEFAPQVTVNTGGKTWVGFTATSGRMTNSAGTNSVTIQISANGVTTKTVTVNSSGIIQ